MVHSFTVFLFVIAAIFVALAGLLDVAQKEDIRISKQHLWLDGIFIAITAVFIELLFR
jgi:hypothetical protein